MKKHNRKLYDKKIGELTQKEFEELFNVATDINDPGFRKRIEPFAEQSISSINIGNYNVNDMDFVGAHLLGAISALQGEIPNNHLIVLFGESASGKSYLIQLISELKNRELKEITEDDRVAFGFEPQDYTADREIREFKAMADLISIIQKKTTRPSRGGNPNKVEIQEGMSREEVEQCEWTYEFAGNLYGIPKREIDAALKNGDAIVIVNDPSMETMRNLKQAYPKNFSPVLVYVDVRKETWKDMMKQANRTEEEIEKRMHTVGIAQKIYEETWKMRVGMPETIINVSEGRETRYLLRQLKDVMERKDKNRDIIEDLEKE